MIRIGCGGCAWEFCFQESRDKSSFTAFASGLQGHSVRHYLTPEPSWIHEPGSLCTCSIALNISYMKVSTLREILLVWSKLWLHVRVIPALGDCVCLSTATEKDYRLRLTLWLTISSLPYMATVEESSSDKLHPGWSRHICSLMELGLVNAHSVAPTGSHWLTAPDQHKYAPVGYRTSCSVAPSHVINQATWTWHAYLSGKAMRDHG